MDHDSEIVSPLKTFLAGLPPELEPPTPDSPRGRIILSAKLHFAAKGFAATSIRTIATTAEVNVAMINYYFTTKKALYQRVIVSELIDTFRRIQRDMPEGLTPDQVVLHIPLAIATVLRDNLVWAQLIRRELSDGAPCFKLIFDEMGGFGPQGLKKILISMYNQAIEASSLKSVKPLEVIPVLIAIGYGIVILDPVLAIISGGDIANDDVWQARLAAIRLILNEGLAVNKKGIDK